MGKNKIKSVVKCPLCKAEIETLLNIQSGYKTFEMNKKGDYTDSGFDVDDNVNEWACPECNEVLATSEEEAIAFLNGKWCYGCNEAKDDDGRCGCTNKDAN